MEENVITNSWSRCGRGAELSTLEPAGPKHDQEEGGSGSSAALGAGSEVVVNSFLHFPVSVQVTVDLMSEVHAVLNLQHIFIWYEKERLQGRDLAPLHLSQAPVTNVKPVEAASVTDGNL